MKSGSWNDWLSTFSARERRYVDTTLETYSSDMRVINTPKSRRPMILAGMEFKTQLFTAICAGNAGDVRYILSVERVK